MKNTLQRTTRAFGPLLLMALTAGLALGAEPSMPMMSKAEVKELIAKGSTSDHHRLALYFKQKAEMMDAEAVEHDELAKEYANNAGGAALKQPMSGRTAAHCKYFAQAARKAATEDRALAAAHEDMALKAKSK